MIMKLSMKSSSSSKESNKAILLSRSTMTTIGSQMKISSSSLLMLIQMKNLWAKILELESQLLMMINQVRLPSTSKEPSELSQLSHLKSRLSERMEVTVSSLLTTRPSNLINLSKPLLPEETSSMPLELLLSNTAKLNRLLLLKFWTTNKKLGMRLSLSNSRTLLLEVLN